jgi:dipeptidase E
VPDPLLSRGRIVAIGGWGLLNDTGRPLAPYLVELTGRDHPLALFIGTASGDGEMGLVSFYAGLGRIARASHLPLFIRPDDIAGPLGEADLIYVGGGNTVNMLAVWRIHGVDAMLRDAWERGAVLAGVSAGSLCWFESGVTDSFGPALAPFTDGLGFLPGSNCPHYDSEERRRPLYRSLVRDGTLPPGFAADDGAALVFAGTELEQVVSWRDGARAYRLERDGEDPIEPSRRL